MPKRRSEKKQKKLYKLWQQSGLTGAEFCKQNRISSNSLWRWKKKFGTDNIDSDANISTAKDLKFYRVAKIKNDVKDSFLELMLPKGISYRIYLSENSINAFLFELLK